MAIEYETAKMILRTYNIKSYLSQLYSRPMRNDGLRDLDEFHRIAISNEWITRHTHDGTEYNHLTEKGRYMTRFILNNVDPISLTLFNSEWDGIEHRCNIYEDYSVIGAMVSLTHGDIPWDFEHRDRLEHMIGGMLIMPDGKDSYKLTEQGMELVKAAERVRMMLWGDDMFYGTEYPEGFGR